MVLGIEDRSQQVLLLPVAEGVESDLLAFSESNPDGLDSLVAFQADDVDRGFVFVFLAEHDDLILAEHLDVAVLDWLNLDFIESFP